MTEILFSYLYYVRYEKNYIIIDIPVCDYNAIGHHNAGQSTGRREKFPYKYWS